MDTKHTPGPWMVDERSPSRLVWANNTRLVADLAAMGEEQAIPFVEQRANAMLIAAAPEVLEALETVVGALSGRWPEAIPDFVRDACCAAIAKARGAK